MRQLRVPRVLLLLTVTCIVYASVYPLQLHRLGGDFALRLVETWRINLRFVSAGDVAANFLLYAPLGFLTFFSLPARYRGSVRMCIAFASGFVLSSVMEVVQLFEVDRVSSFVDVITNTAGAVFGASAAAKLSRKSGLVKRPAPLFLFVSWAAATVLRAVDRDMHVPAVAIFPLCAGAIAAVVIALEWGGRPVIPRLPVALLLLIALVWRELAPFRFAPSAQPFEWVPFAASFRAARGSGLIVFADKIFFYGATVWFTTALTGSLTIATVAVAGLLGILEALQTYQPGRTPEISDAVLTLVVGFVLYLLELRTRKNSERP